MLTYSVCRSHTLISLKRWRDKVHIDNTVSILRRNQTYTCPHAFTSIQPIFDAFRHGSILSISFLEKPFFKIIVDILYSSLPERGIWQFILQCQGNCPMYDKWTPTLQFYRRAMLLSDYFGFHFRMLLFHFYTIRIVDHQFDRVIVIILQSLNTCKIIAKEE